MKQIPHNIDAEKAVLGSILIDSYELKNVDLSPDDFFQDSNKVIYSAMLTLKKRGTAIDQITLANELERLDKLKEIGGAGYLSHLTTIVPTSLDADHYAEIVRNLSINRGLITAGQKIMALGYNADCDTNKSISSAMSLVSAAGSNRPTGIMGSEHIANGILSMIDDNKHGQGLISWGFRDLDYLTGGISRNDYIVMGARPSTGKTEVGCQILLKHAACQRDVLIFSMEMGENQFQERLTAIVAGCSVKQLRQGGEEIQALIAEAAGKISAMSLNVLYDTRTVEQLEHSIARLMQEKALRLILIDYIGLFPEAYDRKYGETMALRMGYISKSLRRIANYYKVPIIALSQFSRDVVRRGGRPTMEDLRDSGCIEQDADGIILLHREQEHPEILELLNAKNRADGANYECVKLLWDNKNHVYRDMEWR